jgi:hypothetical protein
LRRAEVLHVLASVGFIRLMKRGGGRRHYRLRIRSSARHLPPAARRGLHHQRRADLREQGIDQVKHDGELPAPAVVPQRARVERPRAVFATQGAAAVPAASASSRRTPAGRAPRDRVLAAIAELEACRSILLGKPLESSARRRPAKQRRAARP